MNKKKIIFFSLIISVLFFSFSFALYEKKIDDEIIIKSKNISDIKLNIHDQSMLYNYILDGYEDN